MAVRVCGHKSSQMVQHPNKICHIDIRDGLSPMLPTSLDNVAIGTLPVLIDDHFPNRVPAWLQIFHEPVPVRILIDPVPKKNPHSIRRFSRAGCRIKNQEQKFAFADAYFHLETIIRHVVIVLVFQRKT